MPLTLADGAPGKPLGAEALLEAAQRYGGDAGAGRSRRRRRARRGAAVDPVPARLERELERAAGRRHRPHGRSAGAAAGRHSLPQAESDDARAAIEGVRTPHRLRHASRGCCRRPRACGAPASWPLRRARVQLRCDACAAARRDSSRRSPARRTWCTPARPREPRVPLPALSGRRKRRASHASPAEPHLPAAHRAHLADPRRAAGRRLPRWRWRCSSPRRSPTGSTATSPSASAGLPSSDASSIRSPTSCCCVGLFVAVRVARARALVADRGGRGARCDDRARRADLPAVVRTAARPARRASARSTPAAQLLYVMLVLLHATCGCRRARCSMPARSSRSPPRCSPARTT